MIGDARPYLTALIGIELDTVGDWAQRAQAALHHLPRPRREDRGARAGPVHRGRGQRAVRHGSSRSRSSAMLPKELDHEDGELTATQKVKRKAIATMFADLVEGMYRVTELVQCLVRGLGDGSVYALLAFGFVIIYKSMRRDQLRPAGVDAGRRGARDLPGHDRELLPRGGAGRRRGGAARGGRGADRAAPDDRQAGVRHRDHHAGRRHRDPGGRQRLHRPGRAAGGRPVGAVDDTACSGSRCSSGTWSCSSPRWCWSPSCSRSSATRAWAWRCARSPSTRRWRWPKGFGGPGVRAVVGDRRRARRGRRGVRVHRRRASTSSCGSSR